MAARTLYQILEVSETATHEAVRAAYVRLSRLYDPAQHAPQPEDAVRYMAVKEAFLTLGNTDKRAAYDRRLSNQWQAAAPRPSLWTLPRLALIGVLALSLSGGYLHYRNKQEQARIAQEQAIAAGKAREADEAARATAEAARERLRNQALDERQRREREASLARFQHEQRFNGVQSQIAADRERIMKERVEAQRRREEAQAAQSAQMQLQRERAALCQLERARYGHAISCGG